MRYIITTKEHDFRPPVTWNRRKAMWQTYETISCVYPTHTGAARMAEKLARSHIGMTMKIVEIHTREEG